MRSPNRGYEANHYTQELKKRCEDSEGVMKKVVLNYWRSKISA